MSYIANMPEQVPPGE